MYLFQQKSVYFQKIVYKNSAAFFCFFFFLILFFLSLKMKKDHCSSEDSSYVVVVTVARIFQILSKNYEALVCHLNWQKYDSKRSKFHPNAQRYIVLIKWVSKVLQPTYWNYKNNSQSKYHTACILRYKQCGYIDFRWALYVCF